LYAIKNFEPTLSLCTIFYFVVLIRQQRFYFLLWKEDMEAKLLWKEPAFRSSVTLTPVRKLLVSKQSKFQDLKVADLQGLGRVLLTDGFTQSAEVDEFCYHESLVHPAMLLHPYPRHVFLGGGGEGGTLREVLKHPTVEKVVMVDIDKELVDFCREYLPQWSNGAFEDKRVELHYEDARAYLRNCKKDRNQSFDVVIMDVCDPSKDSAVVKLYEQEFYQELKHSGVLHAGFVFVTQSGPAGLCSLQEVGSVIHHTLRQVFPHVVPYRASISSFFDEWGFNIAYDSKEIAPPDKMTAEDVERRLQMRFPEDKLKFYNASCHLHLFGLPKCISEIYANETRIIKSETPYFMNTEYEQQVGEFVSC
jgi:spermidine synthase